MSSSHHPAPTQWIIFTLLAFAAVMILAGCATPGNEVRLQEGAADTYLTEVRQVLSDGRTVTCLKNLSGGGLSCDWANAREAGE